MNSGNLSPSRHHFKTRLLKQDGGGKTYLSFDPAEPAQKTLIKVIPQRELTNLDQVADICCWFHSIRHPHIAPFQDVVILPEGDLYSSRSYLERKPMPSGGFKQFSALLQTIAFIHKAGHCHGNIKPSNLISIDTQDNLRTFALVDPYIPITGLSNRLTIEDIHFTAPEILGGAKPSADSDLYSLGCLFFWLVSGRHVFEEADRETLVRKHLNVPPNSFSKIASLGPDEAEGIRRLLDKDPLKRAAAHQTFAQIVNKQIIAPLRTPFLGRDQELRATVEFIVQRPSGLKLIIVQGEKGIGKTRFLEEIGIRSRFSGFHFININRIINRTTTRPFGGVRQMLTTLFRDIGSPPELGKSISRYAHAASAILKDDESESGWKTEHYERVLSDLVGIFSVISKAMRFVVVVDDAAFLDVDSLRFLEQACLRAADIPSRIVIACDTVSPESLRIQKALPFLSEEEIRVINLEPLDSFATRKFASLLNCNDLDRTIRDAGGNPLFIEACAGLDVKNLRNTHPVDAYLLPVIGSVGREGTRILRIISVFSEDLDIELLKEISGPKCLNLVAELAHLVRLGLLRTVNNKIDFRNNRIREIVCSRLPARVRRELHESAYRQLKIGSADHRVLGTHARSAHLPDLAIDHFRLAGENYYALRDFSKAYEAFAAAHRIALQINRSVPISDELKRALSCMRLGKRGEAKKILCDLTTTAKRNADSTQLSEIYRALANHTLTASPNERIHFLGLALSCDLPDPRQRLFLSIQLAQVKFQSGKLEEAFTLLNDVTVKAREIGAADLGGVIEATRGYLQLNAGRHREALSTLRAAPTTTAALSCGAQTNVALCHEQLGDFRKAWRTQLKAQAVAERIGFVYVRLSSIANLASFAVKKGLFEKAKVSFSNIDSLIRECIQNDPEFEVDCLTTIRADESIMWSDLGEYERSRQLVTRSWRATVKNRIEPQTTWTGLMYCEVNLRIGDLASTRRFLSKFDSELLRLPFYRIEHSLLEARANDLTDEYSLRKLNLALSASKELGTRHQQCRVLLEIAHYCLTKSDFVVGAESADQALKIARQNGYRPLEARATLLRGIASKNNEEKNRLITVAYKLSSEIGLPELIGESSYHLGIFQFDRGHYLSAQEHLLRSTVTTGKLVENVPVQFRTAYLSKPWRKQARIKLDECTAKLISVFPQAENTRRSAQDVHFMESLYKLSLTIKTCPTLEAFTNLLITTIGKSIRYPVMAYAKSTHGLFWSQAALTHDEIRLRVRSLAEKWPNKPYFGGASQKDGKGSIAWVPFETQEFSGGLYVQCRKKTERLSEQEMEYLTILGTIAGSALDRIHQRPPEIAKTADQTDFHGLVGSSRAIKEVYRQIEIAGTSPATVLIEGESGTGKELVARAIHECGSRAKGPFVPVDCGAIAETLIESELFGSKRGSFTGAIADRAGLFEAANGGTIFLDEISNTSAGLQARLLRVIQEREVRRIGETKGRTVDVRLIVATNTNLDSLVQQRQFRQDLLYRLKVLHIKVPPLRSRREDIPALATAFIAKLNLSHHARKHPAPAFIEQLSLLNYPGNVRELHNLVERSYVFTKGAAITAVPADHQPSDISTADEVRNWFIDLTEGRKDFWSAVHDRYKRRDISREKLVALVDMGLRSTRGNYKTLAARLQVKEKEYRRFMDFLRRSECRLDFRPYRKLNP